MTVMDNFELAKAYFLEGCNFLEAEDFSRAEEMFKQSLERIPDRASTLINLSAAQLKLHKYAEASITIQKVLSVDPANSEAYLNLGVVEKELKHFELAIQFFDKAITINPNYHEAFTNKANALNELMRYDEALVCHDKALSLNANYYEAWSNKGNTLYALKRYNEAIRHYDQALSLQSDYHEAWSNKGVTLQELKRYDEAIVHYERAINLKADIDWLSGALFHVKMKISSWSDFIGDSNNISKQVMAGEKAVTPFVLLGMSDEPLLHKQAAKIFAQAKYPTNLTLGPISSFTKKEKIRLAYFSPDFRNHPVSFLTAELFEIHDRSRFEVFAFSLQQAPVGDEMNLRLRKGFDKFIEVVDRSDQEIAQLARELGIDIAIDLAGPTQHSRTGIFSYRAAPIQVNWLGYPGTMGADSIDYIVADKTIIPTPSQHHYFEKVVTLPHTYMVDDSRRMPSTKIFTREECGLPQNAFVFCCFNNDYKFNPQVLDSWARILLTVNNSVIWIPENNNHFKVNITAEFRKRGINSDRIIFAQRVDLMEDHLARYYLADLFLDTHPYNAHTTAVDSLKAGLPVLTLAGKSFASRVAASLLNVVGLPELIANNPEEYEKLAIELANTPLKLADIRLKLANNRLTTPLFDTPLFAKNLEAAYLKMYERYQANLSPDHIYID